MLKNPKVNHWGIFYKIAGSSLLTSLFFNMSMRFLFAVSIYTMDIIIERLKNSSESNSEDKLILAGFLGLLTIFYVIK